MKLPFEIPSGPSFLIPLTTVFYSLNVIIPSFFFPNELLTISTIAALYYLAVIITTIIRADLRKFSVEVGMFTPASLGFAIGTAVFAPTVIAGIKIGFFLFFLYFSIFALALFFGFMIQKDKFRKNFEGSKKNMPYVFEA